MFLSSSSSSSPPQVPPLPAHAGAAAVRALPEGAGERSVHQVHRRAAAAALAALLQEAQPAAAGAGRAAAGAAAAGAARQRRRQVRGSRDRGGLLRDRTNALRWSGSAALCGLSIYYIKLL